MHQQIGDHQRSDEGTNTHATDLTGLQQVIAAKHGHREPHNEFRCIAREPPLNQGRAINNDGTAHRNHNIAFGQCQ